MRKVEVYWLNSGVYKLRIFAFSIFIERERYTKVKLEMRTVYSYKNINLYKDCIR